MIGKSLAHFDVTEKIGAGGMGEVYRARDTKLGRDVALKLLPESFAADADRLARFEREAKLLAGLNHPNIASIYDIMEVDSQRFLVLELVDGIDLGERLKQGPLIVDDALAVGFQIAEALEAAHEQGVVHRDLKPANVIVTADGTVKVLDFGLAKAIEGDSGTELSHSPTLLASSPTMQGVILGTAPYMSPEQARGRTVDRRTDIWAFGVTLVEMLTARRVFDGETVSDTLASVIKTEPDWDSLPKSTPPAIVRLLRRCLDKDAKTRLRDIGEARIMIDKVLRGEIEEESTGAAESATASSRGRIGWIAGVAIAAVVAAAGAWFAKPGAPEPQLRKFSIAVETEDSGSPFDPAISPDGNSVAYILDNNLYVQELDQLTPRKIGLENAARMPIWSPDGESIAFLMNQNLWKVPAIGGTSVRICDPTSGFTSGRGADWSDDGLIIYAHGSSPIYAVSAAGGDPYVYLELAENESDFHEPSLLPDGKGIIFVTHRKNSAPNRIELWNGTERKLLVHVDGLRLGSPQYSSSGHIVYHRGGPTDGVWAVPFSLSNLEVTGDQFPVAAGGGAPTVSDDGSLVYLRGSTGQQQTMVWIDRDGTISEPFAEVTQSYDGPAVSPDGRQIAVSEWDGTEVDIWIHDLERGTRTRFTFKEGPEFGAEWTPDGENILYREARTDSILLQKADGPGEPIFVADGRSPSLSGDGKFLVYHVQGGKTQEDVWYVGLEGDTIPKALVATAAREYRARISPDGQYVVYASDASGDFDIYLTRFPSGDGKWQVSTAGGNRPRWAKDGKSLFYQTDGCSIMEVSFSDDSQLVLGKPESVVDCSELNLVGQFGREFEFHPDGKRILWTKSAASAGPKIDVGITVVENWAKEFEK